MRDNTPKSTRTQGGDPIADYIRADTRLPAYLPYPRFLLKMEISQTAKLLYSLLLDRSTLSQKNKWLDDEGRIYIIYPIAEKMYQQANPQGGQQPGPDMGGAQAGSASSDPNVVDADYEVVDDDNQK